MIVFFVHYQNLSITCEVDEGLTFLELYTQLSDQVKVDVDKIVLSKASTSSKLEIESLSYPVGAFLENNEVYYLSSPGKSFFSFSPSKSLKSLLSPIIKSFSSSSSKSHSPPSKQTHNPSEDIGIVQYGPLKNLRIIKRKMAGDNSCLFHALHDMLRVYDVESPYSLRELVSNTIMKNPTKYATFLSKSPKEYAQWITNEASWGGAVEVSIVAKHFGIEIDTIDVQRLASIPFNHPPDPADIERDPYYDGNESNPTARGIVCFTGTHYDLFAFNSREDSPMHTDVTLFSMEDPVPLQMALEVCKNMNQRGSYSDNVEKFCKICNAKLIGNRGVLEHGNKTGHFSF